jgi:hypothetical protein
MTDGAKGGKSLEPSALCVACCVESGMDTLRRHPWAGLGSSGHAFGPTMKHQAYQDPIAEVASGQATPFRSRVEEGRTEHRPYIS